MTKKNWRLILYIFLVVVVGGVIGYSCQSGPSLAEIRGAREMMRRDMGIIIRNEHVKIVDFNDDRKTKVGSAMLSISVAADSWSPDLFDKYEKILNSMGWVKSNIADGNVFLCKDNASAWITEYRSGKDGYIYMKYPSDPRAKCKK